VKITTVHVPKAPVSGIPSHEDAVALQRVERRW